MHEPRALAEPIGPELVAEPISPELVLVDPELARRVRPLVTVPAAPKREPIREIEAARVHGRPPTRAPRVRAVAISLGAVAAIAVVTIATAAVPRADERPHLDASPSPSSSRSLTQAPQATSVPPVATTSKPKPSSVEPASPSVPAKSVDLRWDPVPNADYYNVILWRDGTRLRDYWPRQPRVVLQPRALVRLGGGDASAVHWFVYPVTVEAGRSLVGPVHASGSFTLPPRTGPTR